MKTIKTTLLLVLFLCFNFTVTQAQQAFIVHQDNVKPSKVMAYEKIAKEFHAASIAHNVQSTWYTAMTNDFKYFYITPIKNMAELDERPFADMAKAMGDKFGDMFDRFDQCYSSHGDYIVVRDSTLSYMPESKTEAPENENYRKWFYMYYSPKNAEKMRAGMLAVKEHFKAKGSKEYYRVYKNGFGQMKNYYLVSVSAKDEVDAATKAKANQELLGNFEERWAVFSKVMDYTSKTEEFSGEMRPDLSYSPK
ncbi:hypothetical protein [Algibacter sp. R77976]|uniref:hypothetical protein n=1 Tax=Algibacter sp. R77976 TaxID=3093873 RepID=UPI0037C7A502